MASPAVSLPAASPQPPAAAADENLWQQMLSKATTAAHDNDSTLVVLGDKRCGKSKMLQKFKERFYSDKVQDFLLDYSYAHVKNIRDEDPEDTHTYMNIWEVSSEEHALSVLPVVLKTHGLRNAIYMIALDLSQPWALLTSLQKWIAALTKVHEAVFGSLSQGDQETMKLNISTYNQMYVDYSVRAEEAKSATPKAAPVEIKVDPDIPKTNLGVPLMVVGCKADTLAQVCAQQAGVGDRFEYITRHLRKICLDYGASLVFTSSVGQSGTGIDAVQEYIYHRLYKFEFLHPSKPVGSESDFSIRVFSGFDSLDLINSIQPAKASWADDAPLSEVFKDPTQAKAAAAAKREEEVKAEDNEIFFKTLKFTMEKGTSRVRTRINLNPNAIAEAANSLDRAPSIDMKAPPTGAAASAPSGSPVATAAAPDKGAVGTPSAGRPAIKNDQRAVKDFFRSLLTSTPAKSNQVGKDALEQLKADKQ